MKKLVNDYKKARAEIIGTINRFPAGKEKELFFDEWNLKNMVSHLSGWAEHQIKVLRNIKKGVTTNEPTGLKEKINEKYVAQRKKKSWSVVYREFQLLSDKLLKDYQTLPEKLWEKPVWNDNPTTPIDLIRIETNHYHKTHGPQIKRIIRKRSTGGKNSKNK